MNSTRNLAVKNPALSDSIVLGGPNKDLISSSMNLITTSAEEFSVVATIGQTVRCSKAMRRYLFTLPNFGNGPAKSIEYVSNMFVRGMFSVFRYGISGLVF